MPNKKIVIAAILAGVSTPTAAENGTVEPIIVTATRTAQTVDGTLASVTVIDRDAIASSHSNTLFELLQSRTVGLDISRTGGPGSSSSIYLRGSESDHVLVLIDGVRVASVTTGSFNWAGISPEQIERIEIVRGPNSTLYGSEAIGGVIQIFTRKGDGMYASLTGGSYRTGKASVGTDGQLGGGRIHINFSHEQDEGFSSTSSESSRFEADRDGYRRSSVGAGLNLPLNARTDLAVNLLHSSGRSDYDDSGYSDAYADTINSSGEMRLDWQASEIWSQRFVFNASQDRYESHDSWPAEITTQRRGGNWQNDLALGEASLLTLGLELQQDHGEITDNYNERIDNRAGFLQYQWSGERFDLLIGGRSDDHSKYGRHNTGRLTLGSRLGAGRIYASYATAFKAPTFNELYYPFYGNPDIEPEESTTTELGYRLGGLQASLYQTRVENLIQSDPLTWQAVNVGKAQLEGLELEYNHKLGQWQLGSGVTLQRSEDEKSGESLLRRAEKKLFFTARGPVSARTTLGIEANYTGPREDTTGFPAQRIELSSYILLNLSADYRMAKRWTLGGRIENLLDEEYELASGYNTAGASAYLTLSYRQ
ncbi:MAG: TonB-dependent receptor [Gammaproteobacteria bacterium]|nr:TonB-dependent receptor [Gammaproteobacteria bacterium]